MAPLVALVVGSIVARIAGWLGIGYVNSWTAAIAGGLAAMLLVTGVAHFAPPMRRDLIAIVPSRLPEPGLLVTVTGVLELLGAAGLLLPVTRVAAAACLLALMLAMFPANVYAARQRVDLAGKPPTPLPLRTALQVVFVAATLAVALG